MTTQYTEQLNNISLQQVRLTVTSVGRAATEPESNVTPFPMSHRITDSPEGEMIASFLFGSLKLMKNLRESLTNQDTDGLQQSTQELKGNIASFATEVASGTLRNLKNSFGPRNWTMLEMLTRKL